MYPHRSHRYVTNAGTGKRDGGTITQASLTIDSYACLTHATSPPNSSSIYASRIQQFRVVPRKKRAWLQGNGTVADSYNCYGPPLGGDAEHTEFGMKLNLIPS
jgi:hypothetical protein